jgi:GNAT superfamily N-acetyltransferase
VLSTAGAVVLSGDGIASPVNQETGPCWETERMASPTADVSVRVAWADDAAPWPPSSAGPGSEYAGLCPPSARPRRRRDAEAWRQRCARPATRANRVLVALERNRVVGFAVDLARDRPRLRPGADAELQELVVDADERGKGHGSRLLQAVVDTMQADRFTRAVTWTVADADDLRRFLTDAGWAPTRPTASSTSTAPADHGQAGPAAHRPADRGLDFRRASGHDGETTAAISGRSDRRAPCWDRCRTSTVVWSSSAVVMTAIASGRGSPTSPRTRRRRRGGSWGLTGAGRRYALVHSDHPTAGRAARRTAGRRDDRAQRPRRPPTRAAPSR